MWSLPRSPPRMQERVLYYDTYSVIYLTQLGQPEPRLANYISDLTDELGGEHITVFASGVTKNYRYFGKMPQNSQLKQFNRINQNNLRLINYSVMFKLCKTFRFGFVIMFSKRCAKPILQHFQVYVFNVITQRL